MALQNDTKKSPFLSILPSHLHNPPKPQYKPTTPQNKPSTTSISQLQDKYRSKNSKTADSTQLFVADQDEALNITLTSTNAEDLELNSNNKNLSDAKISSKNKTTKSKPTKSSQKATKTKPTLASASDLRTQSEFQEHSQKVEPKCDYAVVDKSEQPPSTPHIVDAFPVPEDSPSKPMYVNQFLTEKPPIPVKKREKSATKKRHHRATSSKKHRTKKATDEKNKEKSENQKEAQLQTLKEEVLTQKESDLEEKDSVSDSKNSSLEKPNENLNKEQISKLSTTTDKYSVLESETIDETGSHISLSEEVLELDTNHEELFMQDVNAEHSDNEQLDKSSINIDNIELLDQDIEKNPAEPKTLSRRSYHYKSDDLEPNTSNQHALQPTTKSENILDLPEIFNPVFNEPTQQFEIDNFVLPEEGRTTTSNLQGNLSDSSNSSECFYPDQSISTTPISELSLPNCNNLRKGPLIGQGSFGKVWQGMTEEGHLIAIKQVDLPLLDREQALKEYKKLQREVNILKDMRHPNIVSFIDTSLDKNVVSIYMEYLSGGTITSILRMYGPLVEPIFKRYSKQILEGVCYLHSENVVHRDINGNNVMLLPSGIIKLIDFGCAKRLQQMVAFTNKQTATPSTFVGTTNFMAPEVITDSKHGPKSDIWSVGCTIYEMSTGKPPLNDLEPITVIFHIGQGKPMPEIPENCSPQAHDIMKACLNTDRKKRPTAKELLNHAFFREKVRLESSEC